MTGDALPLRGRRLSAAPRRNKNRDADLTRTGTCGILITMATMTDALKRAIAECGLPMLTLEQRTGVKRQSIVRFMAGTQSLRLDMADKLAAYFGLELKAAGRRPRRDRSDRG